MIKYFSKVFDKFLFISRFKLIQRLRLIEKKLNILYEIQTPFNSKKFTTISKLLMPVKSSKNIIRLGSKNDGGYLLINKSYKNSLLITFGIGDNLDFEEDWIKNGGKVAAFDGTISNINSSNISELTNNFKWIRKNINFIGHNNSISINQAVIDAIELFNYKDNYLVLKLDIESSEWNALYEISDKNLFRFDQIIVEFHEIIKNTVVNYDRIFSVLRRLHKNFELIWSHENNYSPHFELDNTRFFDVIETTWHNKKSVKNILPILGSSTMKDLNSPNDPSYSN